MAALTHQAHEGETMQVEVEEEGPLLYDLVFEVGVVGTGALFLLSTSTLCWGCIMCFPTSFRYLYYCHPCLSYYELQSAASATTINLSLYLLHTHTEARDQEGSRWRCQQGVS